MSDRARVRGLLLLVIALLVVSELGEWVAAVTDPSMGVLAALLATGIYAISALRARRARGARYRLWVWAPTVTLSLVPLALRVWAVLDRPVAEASALEKVAALTPVLVSFVLPVALLLVVYARLGAAEPVR